MKKSLILLLPISIILLTGCQDKNGATTPEGGMLLPTIENILSQKGSTGNLILNSPDILNAINSEKLAIIVIPNGISFDKSASSEIKLKNHIAKYDNNKNTYISMNDLIWSVDEKAFPPTLINGVKISGCTQTVTKKSEELGQSDISYVCSSERPLY